ncbi:MAG: O-antigen ligase family protein [Alphaproteobacteria bacterium]|nr:O-antigen ligase family protein [Alphaproteobacteria bacterium]
MHLPLRGPLQLWVAVGLAGWAALSLVDALNWLRGIILIKALYAQLVLLACVWYVAAPTPGNEGFARKLLWALCAPLAATAFIGILQFQGFNQVSFDAAISGTPYVLLTPLFSLLGWLLQLLQYVTPQWPQSPNLVDQLTGYFLQSAVPGGSFANKNLAGSYTAMMIPLMIYLLLSAKRWWERGLASLLLSLGLVFFVYARARASWLALLATLLVGTVLVLAVPSLRAHLRAYLGWRTLAWFVLPLALVARHADDLSPIQGHGITASPTTQMASLVSAAGGWNEFGGRLAYNLNSLMIVKDYWFNGVGLGSFMVIWPPYYNAVVTTPSNSYNVMARPQRTHSDVMQAFTEMGIPGGTLYVLLFVLGIGAGLRLLGPQAGVLGGKLIGAGLLATLLALTAFLDYRGILRLPGAWHWLFLSALGSWLAYVLLRVLQRLRQVLQQPIQPLGEWQVAGFFGTLGLLCICLNSFLDFPMQLPTAPAAAVLLMGLLLGLHSHLYPTAWQAGPKRMVWRLPRRPALLGVAVVLIAAWGAALYDGAKFKEGNTLLKLGMMRLYAGVADDTTLQILEQANRVYPLDPRIHEHLGVVYANFQGTTPLPLSTRIAKLEWVIGGDPWGANHLVNLAGLYIQAIETARQQGDVASANATLPKLDTTVAKLMKVADFSHFSWGIAGITELLHGRPAAAIPLLQRALTIEPTYAPAQAALQTALKLTGQAPLQVNDALVR